MLTFNEGNCFDFMDSCFLFTFLFLFCIRKQAAMDFRENTWTFERKITKVVLAEVKEMFSVYVFGRNEGYVQEGGFWSCWIDADD